MNSVLKGLLHTAITLLALYVPALLGSSHLADVTIGTVVAAVLNWLLSHSVPTTTGASVKQNYL